MESIRIANAQGFWGDDNDAPARLVSQASIDVLTLDYLAETAAALRAHGVRDREIERLMTLARRNGLVPPRPRSGHA